MAETDTLVSLKRRGIFGANFVDRCFRWGTLAFAVAVPLLILLLAIVLTRDSLLSIAAFGWRFLTTSVWDQVFDHYGIVFAILGTIITSLLALALAVPISIGAAIFLAELAPRWLREPFSFMIELLAAVPSIVYGLWGIFVLVPVLRPVETWLASHLGFLPFFKATGFISGYGLLAAGLILAIMILPYITSVSREVIQAVPRSQREAAYALGATRWEALCGPVLRYARSGIMGAVILGLGRALGETMAVTMLIGNSTQIPTSLFSPGYSMPALLANEFTEATGPLHISALFQVALVLVVITIIVNSIARVLIWSVSKGGRVEVRE
ncbi:MAG TPA: phosphate ABC transporter permease subunit PstC [Armatimonadota bacterium]|jgi:phosphate transport system permease protein